jgi:quercetin 2,3-dioxygenase
MDTTTLALVTTPRGVERLVQGQATSDGAGVKLVRVLTHDLQRRLDPFLMLDAFGTSNPGDYIGGFPDHPHRGFETVTYMLQGRMRHRDSAGNTGLLTPGSVQWMTAGRGVIHSEMPEQQDGAMEGFQLWLNLPAAQKMRDPWYRDIRPEEVPEWQGDGVTARVIAGSTHGLLGAMQRETPSRCTSTCTSSRARASSSRCCPTTTRSSTSTAATTCSSATRPCGVSAWRSWPTRRVATAS